jgi:hypothetical protein
MLGSNESNQTTGRHDHTKGWFKLDEDVSHGVILI